MNLYYCYRRKIEIYYLFYFISAPKEFEVPITTGNFYTTVTQKTPNGLADIYEIVREKVIKCFPQICELLHEDAYSPKTSQG